MTILFKEDWKKHPGAIIHYETKNESFLRLAEIYHEMGIENCAFHLSLLNPKLRDVDPWAPDLTETEKLAVIAECKRNFWYYLREVGRVPTPGLLTGSRYRANRSNIGLYWLYFNHITTVKTVIRQTGKTTDLNSLGRYLLAIGTVGAEMGLLTKDSGLRASTMSDLKEMFEYIPEYMHVHDKNDIFNSELIEIKAMKNKLHARLSNSSPSQADKVGRGLTISTLLVDEFAFINNVEIALSAFTFSGNAAREEARKQGKPYGTIMATTAGELATRDGSYAYQMLANSTRFNEIFFEVSNREELVDIIYKNTSARSSRFRKLMVDLNFTYRQMGYTDEWMKARIDEAGTSSDETIERDLFNKWSTSSAESPISEAGRKRIEESRDPEPRSEIFDPYNFLLRWYVDEELLNHKINMNHALIIGVDTSEGAGGDDIAFYIRDAVTGETLCGAVFNEINTNSLTNFFAEFLIRYPSSTMVIERKSTGPGIIDGIITRLTHEGINPFKRMFNTIVQNKTKYEREFNEVMNSRDIRTYIKYKKHIGFTTSGDGEFARSRLFGNILSNAVKYTAHLARDVILIRQLLGLVYRNGRVDHGEGDHDDTVVAWLLSMWLLLDGRNLNEYGIDSSTILKKNDVFLDAKFESSKSQHDKEEMLAIEKEVGFLAEEIRNARDPIIISQLEGRIRFLYRDLREDTFSVAADELIENLRKEKRLQLRRTRR